MIYWYTFFYSQPFYFFTWIFNIVKIIYCQFFNIYCWFLDIWNSKYIFSNSCGSARTELTMWCTIVVNRGLTTRVKVNRQCVLYVLYRMCGEKKSQSGVKRAKWPAVPLSFWRSVRQSKHVCTVCEGGWMSSGWHAKYGPRRYVRFHSLKT